MLVLIFQARRWIREHRHSSGLIQCGLLIFHFCTQRGLSVSSTLRALAYSMSASRAASQRSALVNSWVDITAPLATPSQLTMIRTWVTIFSSSFLFVGAAFLAARRTIFFAWRVLMSSSWPYRPDDPDEQDRADEAGNQVANPPPMTIPK